MAPMGIRLSPLGVAVFCLLGLGFLYHLYSGALSSRLSVFKQRKTVDLRDLLALSMEAAVQGGWEVKRIRMEDTLEEKSKGKTKEGASEKLTKGDLNSHRKMYYLIKNTYPYIQVSLSSNTDTITLRKQHKTLKMSLTVPFFNAYKDHFLKLLLLTQQHLFGTILICNY